MKKLLTLTLLLFSVVCCVQAQNTVRVGSGGGLAYDKGTNILNIGLGLGRTISSQNYVWWGGYSGVGASINASYELGIHEYFSVGAYGGLGRYGIVRGWNVTAIAVGARGSFHYVALANEALDLGINEDKLDLYVSIAFGAEILSSNIDNDSFLFEDRTYLDFGTILGGRYLVSDRFGVYSEIGYGALSVWTIGATLNL